MPSGSLDWGPWPPPESQAQLRQHDTRTSTRRRRGSEELIRGGPCGVIASALIDLPRDVSAMSAGTKVLLRFCSYRNGAIRTSLRSWSTRTSPRCSRTPYRSGKQPSSMKTIALSLSNLASTARSGPIALRDSPVGESASMMMNLSGSSGRMKVRAVMRTSMKFAFGVEGQLFVGRSLRRWGVSVAPADADEGLRQPVEGG